MAFSFAVKKAEGAVTFKNYYYYALTSGEHPICLGFIKHSEKIQLSVKRSYSKSKDMNAKEKVLDFSSRRAALH